MKQKTRKRHVSLTLFYFLVVFCIQLLAVLLAGGTAYALVRLGALSAFGVPSGTGTFLLLFMMALSAVVCIFLTLLTRKIPLNPFHRLITSMNRLADGDFHVRLEYGRPAREIPAFAELSGSFNIMARELQNTEMLRSDFINNFSHEFKTPIVSIAGFAKLLRRGNLTDEQKEEYLAIIEEESLHLVEMATNVLELTRIENQSILTDVTTFNLSEQIRGCVLLLEDRWTRKNLSLELEFREYTINASEELLKHVWLNLLDNAIKFSPSTGEIRVDIAEEGGTLAVTVTNFGSEIPPDKQARIFSKFYQADESHAARGNGIGLAIVKRVVELHHGVVTVDSRDGRTAFTVTLPKQQ